MQRVAIDAVESYLSDATDDEQTDRLAAIGADRFSELLRRLGD